MANKKKKQKSIPEKDIKKEFVAKVNLSSKTNQKKGNTSDIENKTDNASFIIPQPLLIKNKDNDKTIFDKIIQFLPLVISIISLGFTMFLGFRTIENNEKNQENNIKNQENNKINQDRSKYLDTTNFNIVQNFWQENPSYTLYNESTKPLTIPPKPSYYMYIPAKLFWIFKDGTRFSNLILLPVSYDNVISQSSTGKTIDEITTSVLPKNFYGKLGARDLRSRFYGRPGIDNIAYELRVYPFLAIATKLNYSYKDKPEKPLSENFVTTPWSKEPLSDTRYNDLENYTRNIAHFPENEIKIVGDDNIYDTAFAYLDSQFSKFIPMLKEGFKNNEEQQRYYTLMGNRWDMKYDPQKDILDYSKPSEDNFHSLGRELSDKVIPAKDPLYPDY